MKHEFYRPSLLKSPKECKVYISPRAINLSKKYKDPDLIRVQSYPETSIPTPTAKIETTINSFEITDYVGDIKSMDHLSFDKLHRPITPTCLNWKKPMVFKELSETERMGFSQNELKSPIEGRMRQVLKKEPTYISYIYKKAFSTNYSKKKKLPFIKWNLKYSTHSRLLALNSQPTQINKQKTSCKFLGKKKLNQDDMKKIKQKIKEYNKQKQRVTMKKLNRFKPDIVNEDFDFYMQLLKETNNRSRLHQLFVQQPAIAKNYFSYKNMGNENPEPIPLALPDTLKDRLNKVTA
jgi:hypothetical protein